MNINNNGDNYTQYSLFLRGVSTSMKTELQYVEMNSNNLEYSRNQGESTENDDRNNLENSNNNDGNYEENSNANLSNKEKSQFVCAQCKQQFVLVSDYTRHMRMVHNESPYSCHLCNKKFKIEACYWKHITLHQTSIKHKCEICCQEFSDVQDLAKHLHTHKGSSLHIKKGNVIPQEVFMKVQDNDPTYNNNNTHQNIINPNNTTSFKPSFQTTNNNYTALVNTINTTPTSHLKLEFQQPHPNIIHNNNQPSSINHMPAKVDPMALVGCGSGVMGAYDNKINSLVEGINVIDNVKGKKVVVYHCTQCDKSYNRQLLYDEHLRVHAGLKPFCCEICGRMFARESNLAGHRQSHKQTKVYRCKVCKVKFSIKQKLVLHERVHDMQEPFKCHLCVARFVREPDLQDHLMSHTEYAIKQDDDNNNNNNNYINNNNNNYNNNNNNNNYNNNNNNNNNYNNNNNKNNNNNVVVNLGNNEDHQQELQPIIEEIILDQNIISETMGAEVIYSSMEIPETVYSSDGLLTNTISYLASMACGQDPQEINLMQQNTTDAYTTNDNFKSYEGYNHTGGDDFNNNNTTPTSYETAIVTTDISNHNNNNTSNINNINIISNLKQELLSEDEDNNNNNNDNNNNNNDNNNINIENPTIAKNGERIDDMTHYLTPSGKIRAYIFCEVCGQPYKLMREYQDHMRRHTGHKPYCCEVCGKTFHRSKNLSAHRYSHVEVKRHKCDVCGKSFPLSTRLKIHQRIHTGEKPYECELCHQRFIRRNDYMDHRRKHTGGNTCVHCNKKYSKLETLREHINDKHNKVKPIKCKLCDERFSYSVALYRHMKKHRGQEKDLNKKVHFCTYCQKSFTRPCLLNRHIIKAHPLQHTTDQVAPGSE